MRISNSISVFASVMNDWKAFLANPRFHKTENTISWHNYEKIFFDEPLSAENVLLLVEKGQYSFQTLTDGAIFQLYYEFDNKGTNVVNASLGYYRINYNVQDNFSEEEYEEYEENNSINSYNEVTWLRLDYQPGSARGIAHSDCHLHIGGLAGSRLVVYGVPTPKQFVEFICALCYPSVYENHRLNNNGLYVDDQAAVKINASSISVIQDSVCQSITHLRIPSNEQ